MNINHLFSFELSISIAIFTNDLQDFYLINFNLNLILYY